MWLLLLLSWSAIAAEPDGFLRLRPAWPDDEATAVHETRPFEEVLRLSIQPVLPLSGATLTVSAPDTVSVRSLMPERVLRPVDTGDSGTRSWRMELEDLDPEGWLALDLAIDLPPGGGGITSIAVEGALRGGRRVREAVGITTGRPGKPGVRRHGAIEFPAVPREEGER